MGSTCTLVGFYLMNRISEKTMVTARSTLISHMERENEQLENIQGVIKEHVLEETQSKMIEFISHPFIQFVVWNTANTSTEIIEL
jgi:predicted thioredoxin/glutaredoxin